MQKSNFYLVRYIFHVSSRMISVTSGFRHWRTHRNLQAQIPHRQRRSVRAELHEGEQFPLLARKYPGSWADIRYCWSSRHVLRGNTETVSEVFALDTRLCITKLGSEYRKCNCAEPVCSSQVWVGVLWPLAKRLQGLIVPEQGSPLITQTCQTRTR